MYFYTFFICPILKIENRWRIKQTIPWHTELFISTVFVTKQCGDSPYGTQAQRSSLVGLTRSNTPGWCDPCFLLPGTYHLDTHTQKHLSNKIHTFQQESLQLCIICLRSTASQIRKYALNNCQAHLFHIYWKSATHLSMDVCCAKLFT